MYMRKLFRQRFEPEAADFLKENRRKELPLYWLPTLLLCWFFGILTMLPAGLLFLAINTWSPLKVPLWVLFLPGLFGATLWNERGNDIDERMALWRAFLNTVCCLVVAYAIQNFLSTNISDRVLRTGIAAKQVSTPPFWACVVMTWTFLTYGEARWTQGKEEYEKSQRHQSDVGL
jgi:hypothetical protein